MKEAIKTAILFVLVLVVGILVVQTKGDDPLVWNVDLNLSWTEKEEFNYPLEPWEYNGEYRNINGSGRYIMMGKNLDDTYRVYFIMADPSPRIELKLDSLKLENDKLSFKDDYNNGLYITLGDGEVVVSPELGLGNAKLEGTYRRMKTIDSFTMSKFELFNY